MRISPTKTASLFKNSSFIKQLKNPKSFIVPGIVLGVWGTQSCVDVKHAAKEDKKNVFINDLLIGAAMIAGGFAGKGGMKRFLGTGKAQKWGNELKKKNFIKRFLLKNPTKDFLETLSVPAGAGIAGGIAGELGQKIFPVKNDEVNEILDKAGLFVDLDYGSMSKAYNYSGLVIAESMDSTFSTLVGYSVGKEKGVKNKVKRFLFEMISGVIVPLAAILPLIKVLEKHLPNSPKTRGTITLGVGIGASMMGKIAAKWFNREITENIAEHKLWDSISQKQKELMKYSMFTNNPFEKQKLLKEVKKLKEVKEAIKNPEFSVHKFIKKSEKEAEPPQMN